MACGTAPARRQPGANRAAPSRRRRCPATMQARPAPRIRRRALRSPPCSRLSTAQPSIAQPSPAKAAAHLLGPCERRRHRACHASRSTAARGTPGACASVWRCPAALPAAACCCAAVPKQAAARQTAAYGNQGPQAGGPAGGGVSRRHQHTGADLALPAALPGAARRCWRARLAGGPRVRRRGAPGRSGTAHKPCLLRAGLRRCRRPAPTFR